MFGLFRGIALTLHKFGQMKRYMHRFGLSSFGLTDDCIVFLSSIVI